MIGAHRIKKMGSIVLLVPLIFLLGCGVIYDREVDESFVDRTVFNPEGNVSTVNSTPVEPVENESVQLFERKNFGLHPGNFTVYFLDKAGFSALIVTPSDGVIVIDSGLRRSAEDNLNSIKDVGYLRADVLILSSIKSYRIGGTPVFIDRLKPQASFYSGVGNEGYEDYRLIKGYLNNFSKVSQDKLVLFDNDVDIKFFVAYDDGTGFRLDDSQNSILVKIIYKNFDVLFGGDCYDECEDRVTIDSDLSSDVLALPLMGRCEADLGVSTFFLRSVGASLNVGTNLCDQTIFKLNDLGVTSHDQKDSRLVVTSDGITFTHYLVE